MNPALEKGAAAAKAGNKQEAFRYLKQAIDEDPRDINAWLWLSSILDEPSKKGYCYQKVLDIDSQNQYALRGMAKLNQQPAAYMQAPARLPVRQTSATSSAIQPSYISTKPVSPPFNSVVAPPKKKWKASIWSMIGTGLFALTLISAPIGIIFKMEDLTPTVALWLLGHYVISGYVGAFKLIAKGKILQLIGCSILLGGLPILLPAVCGWFMLWWANRSDNKS